MMNKSVFIAAALALAVVGCGDNKQAQDAKAAADKAAQAAKDSADKAAAAAKDAGTAAVQAGTAGGRAAKSAGRARAHAAQAPRQSEQPCPRSRNTPAKSPAASRRHTGARCQRGCCQSGGR